MRSVDETVGTTRHSPEPSGHRSTESRLHLRPGRGGEWDTTVTTPETRGSRYVLRSQDTGAPSQRPCRDALGLYWKESVSPRPEFEVQCMSNDGPPYRTPRVTLSQRGHTESNSVIVKGGSLLLYGTQPTRTHYPPTLGRRSGSGQGCVQGSGPPPPTRHRRVLCPLESGEGQTRGCSLRRGVGRRAGFPGRDSRPTRVFGRDTRSVPFTPRFRDVRPRPTRPAGLTSRGRVAPGPA